MSPSAVLVRSRRLSASAGNVGGAFAAPSASFATLDWFAATQKELCDLLALPDNWDSYGAASIDPDSVHRAQRLLWALCAQGIPRPTVTATPTGNAAFCWDDGRASVDVEVCPDDLFKAIRVDRIADQTEAVETRDWRVVEWMLAAG